MAFLILKEEIRKFDWLIMILTLIGTFAVILGGTATASDDEEIQPAVPYFVLYILLMLVPFLSAGGMIAMR